MSSKYKQALLSLPLSIQQQVESYISSSDFEACIDATTYKHWLEQSQLPASDLALLLLPIAASFSYAPISNFYVGAIVTGASGKLYFGANMEFSGTQLGQTVHAEQSAISHAWMKGEQGIEQITINFSPCGHCRQFINELETAQQLSIQLPEVTPKALTDYLPHAFGPKDLGITSGLMSPINHQYQLNSDNMLLLHALNAMNMSYAPYTNNHSGIAIKLKDGSVFRGAYAENAAFNPSLPPLQVALSQVVLHNHSLSEIQAVALVETSSGTISHLADTQATLDTIDPDITFHYSCL